MVGQKIELLLRLLHGGDIGKDRHIIGQALLIVVHRADGRLGGEDLAALAPIPKLTLPHAVVL